MIPTGRAWRSPGLSRTPVISRAILVHNRGRKDQLADGIVITPSHNPPEDGGFKYNPPNGGPADTDVTTWIQDRANELLRAGNADVKRMPFADALQGRDDAPGSISSCPTSRTWRNVIDMEAIRAAGLKLGVDPLGGAAVHYWEPINDIYGLDITVVNPDDRSDLLVHDGGSRRQDPHGLLQPLRDGQPGRPQGPFRRRLRQRPRLPTATASSRRRPGLMNPNHYLAVAIRYLLTHRPGGRATRRSARPWSAAA